MAKNKKKNQDNEIMVEKESAAEEMQPTDVQSANEAGTTTEEPMKEEPTAEERLTAELAAANDKYLRLYAEFDNYKRRVAKERIELMQTAGKEIIASLLPVIDDFERALKAFETATEVAPLKEGVSLVGHKLKNVLVHQGVKEMESIGKPFDAELQEAITNVPAPSEDLKGKVIDEIEKGYFLHDKILRHAKVVVGS
ncbi:nucleotide exchange factor GrpE [Parapedobacter sp. ISTM3]|uniref:Protein GrpE n=1 Tax=Parapedobacter luteus TaxID=623280 RepID=A0A1T5AS15_9SPHI|nr:MULTISPECIES: nucleotide exchange factor GrpE [Parapedobacter]MBK1441998.1 nucleotide exchange factor GrpE [Parapedobacter sp. ISTM3]SKB37617.1 molecular chaperone GrpE [Parapedobacter luteus]